MRWIVQSMRNNNGTIDETPGKSFQKSRFNGESRKGLPAISIRSAWIDPHILRILFYQANAWCARGIELLASQRIEKCSGSSEIAEQSLSEIQQFLASASEFRVSSPREFRNVFQESTTPETKALVTQVKILRIIYWTVD